MIKDALDFQKQTEEEKQSEDRKINPYFSPKEYVKRKIRKKITSKIKKKATEKIVAQLAKKLSEEALKKVLTVAGRTPWGLVVILILFFLLIFIYILFGLTRGDNGSGGTEESVTLPGDGTSEPIVQGLTVSKTGDSEINFGETITYTISVNYDDSSGVPGGKIVIVDKLPANTEFVSATGTHTNAGKTVEWALSDGIADYSFTLVVRPIIDNVEIVNTVFGRSLASESKLLDSYASNLNAIFADAASTASIPEALLRAIAKTESGVLGYSSEEVTQFNSLIWWEGLVDNAPTLSGNDPLVRRGYAYNTCLYTSCSPGADVRGAMQFELGTWNAVASRLSFNDGHSPDRRYVRDVVYGAAYFIRGKIDQYDSRFSFSQNLDNLNETQVKALAKSYCGGNPDANTNDPACGYGRHEASVWAYYQEYNN